MKQVSAQQKLARSWIRVITIRGVLIVFVTAVLLWIHSYWYRLAVLRERGHESAGFEIDRGILTLHSYHEEDRHFSQSVLGSWDFADQSRTSMHGPGPQIPPPNSLLGFGMNRQVFPGANGVKDWTIMLAIPIWSIVVVSGLVLTEPAIGYMRRRRQRRRGFCETCGYDLTGNTSGICPECGSGVSAGGGR